MGKSIAGLEILIMGVMLVFVISIVALLPSFVKSKLDEETIFEYNQNKAQHTILSLLSITHDEKKVSELIAEKYLINKPSNLDFLKTNLDNQIESKCYQIDVSDQNIVSVGCDPEYWVTSTIVLPYNLNNLVEEIRVGIK